MLIVLLQKIVILSGDYMRKKIVFLIFFIGIFILIGDVSASESLEHKYVTGYTTYTVMYKLDGDINEISDEETQSIQDIDKDSDEETLLGNKIKKVYCGKKNEGGITGIPRKIPELTSYAVTLIQIAIPIILVIMGSLDLFKGITAGKEDDMKKGQKMFIKRLAVAAIIFFVVIIVKFFISIVADTNVSNMVDCIDCFISNDCEEM